MSAKFYGYKGEASKALEEAGAEVEDHIRVTKDGAIYEGILIPRSEHGDDKHLIIKLRSGYRLFP